MAAETGHGFKAGKQYCMQGECPEPMGGNVKSSRQIGFLTAVNRVPRAKIRGPFASKGRVRLTLTPKAISLTALSSTDNSIVQKLVCPEKGDAGESPAFATMREPPGNPKRYVPRGALSRKFGQSPICHVRKRYSAT